MSLAVAVIGVLACFVLWFNLFYENKVCQLRSKIWNVFHNTAQDFTIEVILPQEAWSNYLAEKGL